MIRVRRRLSSGLPARFTAAINSFLVLGLIALAATTVPVAHSQVSGIAAAERPPVPDPRFPVPTDLVLEHEQAWQAHLADVRANPHAFDGMVIGVDIDDESATQRAMAEGGEAAELQDEAAAAIDKPARVTDTVATCPKELPAKGPGVYFACHGDEPAGYFRHRNLSNSDDPVSLLRMALEALAAGPTAVEAASGLYTLMPAAAVVRGVTVDESGLAAVDFDPALRRADLGSIATGTTFLEQVVNTVFQFDNIDAIRFSIDGNCEAFWAALGGAGCHVADRNDPRNTP